MEKIEQERKSNYQVSHIAFTFYIMYTQEEMMVKGTLTVLTLFYCICRSKKDPNLPWTRKQKNKSGHIAN